MGFNIGHWLGHVIKGAAGSVGSDVLSSARANLPPDLQQGFDQAVSTLNNPQVMGTVGGFMRDRLHVDPRHLPGYDLAASIAGGLSQSPAPPPDDLPPAAQAGYLVTQGLQGADPAVKTAVMTAVAASPAMRQGAAAALGHIAAAREGWWPRFLRAVGLRK